ncbi:GntR family transcriptional regulator [Ruficoccus sp. ZRK36]|uniref:GntR family transcriptional regulator n=1 Tax=Ruficoccus sp. ZRK36 TaxID=2866311 RepID=UPI001C734039|nr:GntR family transcriptional regulator [Ruficoccus sp. ZRK36]QYY35952.1 GntR family transcriptional regulator [Ruficoccus sp. ZRK36]
MKPAYRSLPEHVYQHLLEEIVRGVRPAGSKLTEESICAEMGVSRTPAREALLRLHRDGVVERLPRRGCFIKGFEPAELAELFECRGWIECLALEQAFDHLPDKELAKLEKTLSGSLTEEGSLKADDELHLLIAKSCPNAELTRITRQLLTRSYPVRFWRTYTQAPLKRVSGERLKIVQAMRQGDKPTALRLLREHIEQGRELLLQMAEKQASEARDHAPA